ncbi:MAG: ABC transporter ATP-binding protein [Acidobacteriota bacterium]
MALLEARGLTRRFGGLFAVRRLDLAVERGEILGLIGPNGAGKTTLFHMLSGALRPSEGSIYFEGQRLDGLPPHVICRRGVARTYQIVRPFPNLTVLTNVLVGMRFGRRGGGMPAVAARREALRALELTGLIREAETPARALTLPDRKRLEIARALATRPKLLLLDEVAAGLNPSELEEALELIRKIRVAGTTLIFIEHVMKAVMGLSDRVVVLHHGQKIAEGKPAEVASNADVKTAYLGFRERAR